MHHQTLSHREVPPWNLSMGSSSSAPVSGPTKLEDKYYPEWIKNPENIKDLTGRVALITGVSTSSGLGFYATKALASKGAQCVITVRNLEKGQAVKTDLEAQLSEMGVTATPIVVMKMDNCDFESIRTFTDDFKKDFDRLDIVCNNAGIMGLDVQMTKDGYDVQIQTNHLSHFLMTCRLWPLLKVTAEKYGDVSLTQVSSVASEKGGPTVDVANLNNPHPPHGLLLYLAPYVLGGSTGHWARYGQSKLANVLFAQELNRRVKTAGLGDKVKSNSCHPGLAATNLQITTQQANKLVAWRMVLVIRRMVSTLCWWFLTFSHGYCTSSLWRWCLLWSSWRTYGISHQGTEW